MIKIENEEITIDGNPADIVKEWGNITFAICEEFTKVTGNKITVDTLIKSVNLLMNEKQGEKNV